MAKKGMGLYYTHTQDGVEFRRKNNSTYVKCLEMYDAYHRKLQEMVADCIEKNDKCILSDRLFDENRMYTYVKTYAGMKNLIQTSTALLHDVCEDCGVKINELPVNDTTKEAVALLTKDDETDEESYYQKISGNPIATMVKLLDRCNNISGMAAGFSKEKTVEYIKETEQFFYPLLQKAKSEYPMYSNQLFLIKYHTSSVMEAIKHQG